jgi:threonine/homoserine/homoserine lactone efflux protein
MTDPLLFFLAAVTLLGAPGPTNALLASAGAVRGFRPALPLLLATLSGYLITVCAVGLLFRPLLATTPIRGSVVKIVVALYLVVLAIRLWRSARTEADRQAAIAWGNVFVATLLNPKGLILALVLVPFGHAPVAGYLLGLAALILATGLAWLGAGHALGLLAGRRKGLLPRTAAVILAAFAGLIAISAFS